MYRPRSANVGPDITLLLFHHQKLEYFISIPFISNRSVAFINPKENDVKPKCTITSSCSSVKESFWMFHVSAWVRRNSATALVTVDFIGVGSPAKRASNVTCSGNQLKIYTKSQIIYKKKSFCVTHFNVKMFKPGHVIRNRQNWSYQTKNGSMHLRDGLSWTWFPETIRFHFSGLKKRNANHSFWFFVLSSIWRRKIRYKCLKREKGRPSVSFLLNWVCLCIGSITKICSKIFISSLH